MLTTTEVVPAHYQFSSKINYFGQIQQGPFVHLHVLLDFKSYLLIYNTHSSEFVDQLCLSSSYSQTQYHYFTESFCALDNRNLSFISTKNGTVLGNIDAHGITVFDSGNAYSQGEIALAGSKQLKIIRFVNGSPVSTSFEHKESVITTAIKWIGTQQLVTTSTSGRVSLFDIRTSREIFTFIE